MDMGGLDKRDTEADGFLAPNFYRGLVAFLCECWCPSAYFSVNLNNCAFPVLWPWKSLVA